MSAETIKELIFSLAWYDASAYHNRNVREILKREFPSTDFSKDLETFVESVLMPPGKGCPR